jgi:hypothetical protein
MHLAELRQHVNTILDNWCPQGKGYPVEPFDVRLIRGFMASTAYAADAHRQLKGKQPIRPLDSYPNPLVGFDDEEKRVKIVRVGLVPGLDSQSAESWAFENMASALGLRKGSRLAHSVANAILLGYEKGLDIDSVESNRAFRSKHTRWFMDNWSDDVKAVFKKGQSVLNGHQIEQIIAITLDYLQHKDNKRQTLECALDEAA